jgi:hypothetical protein
VFAVVPFGGADARSPVRRRDISRARGVLRRPPTVQIADLDVGILFV